jgi:ribosome-associated heat shock protein Hsp15
LESTAACDLVRRSPAWQSLGIITIALHNRQLSGFNWPKKQCPAGLKDKKSAENKSHMDKIRIDKWLWAARFYKTRSLATDEIGKGRVAINDQTVKASREVKVGDTVRARQGDIVRTVTVLGISDQRGPAPTAQALFEETNTSLQLREKISVQRRLSREPALSIEQGRPTKRNRRDLEKAKQVGWNDRWSASVDPD